VRKMIVVLAVSIAAAVAFAEVKKIVSIKLDDNGKIDAGESIDLAAFSANLQTNIAEAVAAATNALAAVAHTGDMLSLTNAPAFEIRANLDADGKTRYRIFSTQQDTPAPKEPTK